MLYALESSFQGPNVRGAHSKSPRNIYPDVEPYLSHPQMDSHVGGFSENVSYLSDLLQLPKPDDITASFCNMSEQLLSAEGEPQNISSLPLSLSVSHWLRETNNKITGSDDAKVLKQHKNCLQACNKGMVSSQVCFASRLYIFSSSSYHIYNYVVKPAPQVLNGDHDLLASTETVVSIKAAKFKAIETLARSPLSVLSYIEHFDVASTKFLQ